MNSILLFDFDGTVALGDGPVLAYAQQVADALPAEARAVALPGVRETRTYAVMEEVKRDAPLPVG